MNIEEDLLLYNYADVMQRIEDRIGETSGLVDFPALFNEIDDGLFAYLCQKSFNGYPKVRALLPDWASATVRQDSTGAFTLHEHILDAYQFWRLVKSTFLEMGGVDISRALVLDYGAGWGRVTRLVAKDVSRSRLFGSEPNPVFQDIFEKCSLPATLIKTDWEGSMPFRVERDTLI